MTYAEEALAKTFRNVGLHFRRQAPIGRYIADFAFHSANLVVEIDGPWHDLPEGQLHDAERDVWLISQGYRILRFSNQQVLDNIDAVLETIKDSLPPRWGKGGDGGACTEVSNKPSEAVQPPAAFLHPITCAPTPPSPIEGEGFGSVDQ